MTRVFCGWELGGGLGHLFRLAPIGAELAKRGCRVSYAIPDITHGAPFLQNHADQILQAPVWQAPPNAQPLSQTYPQVLLRSGYWHRDALEKQLRGWLALFDAAQPDLLAAEHAPTALLAARMVGLPRAAIGTGFSLPPLTAPMPGLQPWFAIPDKYLGEREQEFLDCVNPTLKALGAPALTAAAEIFDGAERLLCALPELDHYGARADTRYWGPVLYTAEDCEPPLPSDERDNIFLYIKPTHRLFRPVVRLLKETGLPTLAFAPGLDADEQRALSSENFSVTVQPVNLKTVAARCRLMISHGGHNAGAFMLRAGVPLFICPMEVEQAVWAYRLRAQGLADAVNFFNPERNLKHKIESALSENAASQPVREFASRYATLDPGKQIAAIVEQCLFAASRAALDA